MRAGDALAVLRAAPLRSFDELFGTAPILVLAPHPDDESLACGGLIAEAVARGHDIWVAILTDGGASHRNSPTWPRQRLVAQRAFEAAAAVASLGLPPDRLLRLGELDGEAPREGPALDAAAGRLVDLLQTHRVGTLVASWIADPHGDHVAAARLAAAASSRTGVRHLSYPVWAWTLPDEADIADPTGRAMRLDVARHLPAKRRAIAAHITQHGGLIDDDPEGFALPADFLARFDGPAEVFIAE